MKYRKKKFDFQVECIRLLDKMKEYGPLSRKEIAFILSDTFNRTVIPGSWALRRALKSLLKKGDVIDSGNPHKPYQHLYVACEQTYNLARLIRLEEGRAPAADKLSEKKLSI